MEVLLVLVILVVLASMVVTMFSGTQEKALKDAAKGQVGFFKSGDRPLQVSHQASTRPAWKTSSPSRATPTWPIAGPGRTWTDKVPLDPWDNEYKFAAPGKHNPIRSTSGPSGPMARTAPPTTSAIGKTCTDFQCLTMHHVRWRGRTADARRSLPRARAVGGDRRRCGAADGRLVLARRLQRRGDLLRGAWARGRLAAMQSGQTYVFRFEPNGSRFQFVTLDAA